MAPNIADPFNKAGNETGVNKKHHRLPDTGGLWRAFIISIVEGQAVNYMILLFLTIIISDGLERLSLFRCSVILNGALLTPPQAVQETFHVEKNVSFDPVHTGLLGADGVLSLYRGDPGPDPLVSSCVFTCGVLASKIFNYKINFPLTSAITYLYIHGWIIMITFLFIIIDGFVKSRKCPRIVIPVKTGIQIFQRVTKTLDTGFHRCDNF